MSADNAGISAQTPGLAQGCVVGCPDSGHSGTHVVAILGVRAPVPVSGSRAQRLAVIGRLQRARVRREQLRAAGVTDSAIGRMVARGTLVREHPCVYRIGPDVEIPWGAETAALLACGPGTVLSHRSAAVLWGLLPSASGIEVTVAQRQTGAPEGVLVHRSRTLLPRDVTVRQGLPVTSVARTYLDLADVVKPRQLERAVDEGLLTRLVTLTQLDDVLNRAVGRRGTKILTAIVEREGPSTRTRSNPEERFLALVRQAGLPPPEVNARIHGFEVDFLWRAERVALEIDTWGFHRTRNAFERDRRKGAVLSAGGLSVVRATDTQLGEEPLAVVVRVAQTLAHAA